MNEQGKLSVIYSWPVIILAFMVFWPVGAFLVIRRVAVDKKTALGVGKLIGIVGMASYAIAVLGAIACATENFDSDMMVGTAFFVVTGFVLRKIAKNITKDAETVKKYLAVIVNGNERQLDVIASSLEKKYDVVKRDIQKLIDKGYLKNAYINEGTREVVLQTNNVQAQVENRVNTAANNAAPRVVACSCCGANNTVVGNSGECEYCGSALK